MTKKGRKREKKRYKKYKAKLIGIKRESERKRYKRKDKRSQYMYIKEKERMKI